MPLSLSAPFRTAASAWAAVAAVSVVFAVGLAAAPIAAAADACDNATLRAQNNSTGLPDCRAYEMVTPPYKEGFSILGSPIPAFTDDGVISYASGGSFAGDAHGSPGNLYHGVRSPSGWETRAMGPSSALYNTSINGQLALPVAAESSDLRWSLWRMFRRGETENDIGYWLRDSDGNFARVGNYMPPEGGNPDAVGLPVMGVSADLSHVVVANGPGTAASSALREYVGVNNGWPPRPVSIDNDGQPTGGQSCLRNVSPEGRVIVFSSGCGGGVLQLWARVAGSALVAVSGSECTRGAEDEGGLCNGLSAADYVGGAADGSRVFFTTKQQLVNGDIDTGNEVDPSAGNDLYACDIPAGVPVPVGSANPCSTLTEVSGAGDDAEVQGLVAISEDGSRVYFVARGVLADNLGVDDVGPRAGRDNLYVWDRDDAHPAGQTRFVARLAGNDVGQGAKMTPDGRYLLFTTASRLVTGGAGTDGDDARDLYRYDAVTHSIVRISTSVAGGGGDGAGFDVAHPAMSADGSTVVFDSAEALSVSDTNGMSDVYSWRDGQVSAITFGGGGAVGITASGRDIIFGSDARILPADGDILGDIYTARVGGGFAAPRPPAVCAGDGCQGQLSGAPGLMGPRSGLSGGDPADVAAALSLRAVSAAQRRRLAATGRLTVTVKANAGGIVRATARAKIGGRSVTVASGRRAMTTPGSVAVTLKLSRKARAQLAARGRLTVKLSVSHSRASKGRSVTLKLTRARAKKSSSVGGRS